MVWNPRLAPASLLMKLWGCAAVVSASAGLWLLYLVTTTDPGFIPRGQRADRPSGAAKRSAGGRPSSANGEACNQYRSAQFPAHARLGAEARAV